MRMKGLKKEAKKKISVWRRDLWDRHQWGYNYWKEQKEIHMKETTGGIRLHKKKLTIYVESRLE
jgi:hypothetical protein